MNTDLKDTRVCEQCGKLLKGRVDKRFCDDYCRNAYNNLLKSKNTKHVKIINGALQKNRRILESLLPTEDTIKVHIDRLVKLGFDFTYHTHLYTTKAGKVYTYCYDYGFLALGNDWFLIVRYKEKI